MSNTSQPSPEQQNITPREERAFFVLLRTRSPTPTSTMKAAEDAAIRQVEELLILRNQRVVSGLAKYYAKRYNSDFDNLEQVGKIALWKAIQTFDPNRNVRFITYAYHAVRNAIERASLTDRLIHVPYKSLKENHPPSPTPLSDYTHVAWVDDSSAVDARIDINKLQGRFALLTERQRRLIELRFVYQMSFRDMAEEMGLSLGTVTTHLNKAIHILQSGEPDK